MTTRRYIILIFCLFFMSLTYGQTLEKKCPPSATKNKTETAVKVAAAAITVIGLISATKVIVQTVTLLATLAILSGVIKATKTISTEANDNKPLLRQKLNRNIVSSYH